MLVGVAPLPLSFPPSRTWAFYSINRPPWANISDPSLMYYANFKKNINCIQISILHEYCKNFG